MKTVCIAFAKGCPRSEVDTAWLSPYFEANGWSVTGRPEEADLVVAAGCGFDAANEEESIRLLSLLKKKHDDTPLVVVGCLAGISPERVRACLNATPVVAGNVAELDRIISATVSLPEVRPVNDTRRVINRAYLCWRFGERWPGTGGLRGLVVKTVDCGRSLLRWFRMEGPLYRLLRTITGHGPLFQIRVARGCLEECTYCAIRLASGTFRSKPVEDVLAEFDRGLRQGYKVVELLGEDLGPFGDDMGTTLPELLEKIFSREGEYKLIFTDINVRYVIKYASALARVFSSNAARVQLVRIPVQSGSDRMLALMRRCYTVQEVKQSLEELFEAASSLPIETHVLAGFPGETEEDFLATVHLLRAFKFAGIQVYRYADRIGTPASEMEDKVSESVKEDRVQRLLREFPMAREISKKPSGYL